MLNSLLIRNFRIFKEIEIKKLRRVNLFVGKNNSGKSCLLEALQIYATKGNPRNLSEINSFRDEHWESMIAEKSKASVQEAADPFSYLFHGYVLPEVNGKFIEIGPIGDESNRLKIRLRAFQITEDEEGRRVRVPVEQDILHNKELVDIQIALEAVQCGERCHYIGLDNNKAPYRRRMLPDTKELNSNYQLVPAQKIDDHNVSILWDKIHLTGLEDELVNCLQVIDSNITGIGLVGEQSGRLNERKRIPIIRYAGFNERIPLKTMGDGLTRLFHIVLALVNSKNGLLLIDEFENGLHWSIQAKIWGIIFKLSDELNVQVVATTHSRDCIQGFYDVWGENEEDASLYRLEATSDRNSSIIKYSCEMLSDAIASDIEVR